MRRAARLIGVVSLAVGAMSTVVFSRKAPTLADVLAQAAKYIAEYELAFSAVVSEERYQQTLLGVIARGGRESRTLRSDVLLVLGKETGWVTFRDVYEVDGRAVRDRQDRLANLILKPTSDAAEQARRIAEEGARFNLGPVIRTINTPTMALQVLRTADQPRSAFRLVRHTRLAGAQAAEVEFTEIGRPRFVGTQDDAAASGRFWIETGSGRVLKSEFTLASAGNEATFVVTYERHEKLAMLVPVTMAETYLLAREFRAASRISARPTQIEGYATYSNFRRFSVDTTTVVR